MPGIVDTHAHLDEIADLDRCLDDARSAGVQAIVAVGSGTESNRRVLEIARQHPGFVYAAIGLHPENLAGEDMDRALAFIDAHVHEVVGIGEIGLDYHKRVLSGSGKDRQKAALMDLLRIAESHKKPALIHSRYVWRDRLELAEDARLGKAVFHWYTGPSSVLGSIIGRGYFVSATPAVEYHEEHRRAIRETPIDRLLLETDSPVTYGRGGETPYESRPADARRSMAGVAAAKGEAADAVAAITTKNAAMVFGLPWQ